MTGDSGGRGDGEKQADWTEFPGRLDVDFKGGRKLKKKKQWK